MSKFPTIPDFTNNLESIATAVRAMKDSIEQLTGQRQGQSLGTPSIYVQPQAPSQVLRNSSKIGDLWVNTTDNTLSYWTGKSWQKITV